jgi:hypothetical protein
MSHAVIVYLKLSDDQFGHEAERESIFELEDRIVGALEGPGIGEFDGNEFGGGECTLYMYGDDADRMFNAISPVLTGSPLSRGGYAVKRFGEASDPLAMEVKVPLG